MRGGRAGAAGPSRVATLGGAPDRLSYRSTPRFLALLGVLLLGHLLLAPHLAVEGAAPELYVAALVYGAMRWGPLWGSILGFALGLNLDAVRLDDFGASGLALTIAGFAIGKMRDSLYLDLPVLDVLLILGAALWAGFVVAAVGQHESLAAFEDRFFYEVPLSALYTAALGGLVFRLLRD